jgi:hypothetical protein
LFFQGLCYLDRLIDFAQLVLPWSILYQMPLHVGYQAPHPFAPMVPCDLVVPVAKAALDGVGAGTIRGQKQQLKAGVLPQAVPDRSSLMDFAVVGHEVDVGKAPSWVSPIKNVQ